MDPNHKEYLAQVSKELHKPFKKKYERRTVTAKHKDQIWSCDLVDMSAFSKYNNGIKWMLNCVDVYTRYAFSCPMASKSAIDTYAAFVHICSSSGRKPSVMWVDQGKEFYNSIFKKAGYSVEKGTMYSTFGDHKSVICERFNRTLKTEMWKRLDATNSRAWVPILGELISWYNHKKHSTLGMSPHLASSSKSNQAKIAPIVNPRPLDKEGAKRKPKFDVGSVVRIARIKGVFEKGYEANWSREIFTVHQVRIPDTKTEPITYKLTDRRGEKLAGSFYTEELQKVDPSVSSTFLVESVLDQKVKDGVPSSLIKWLGYSSKFNSWVPTSSLSSLSS